MQTFIAAKKSVRFFLFFLFRFEASSNWKCQGCSDKLMNTNNRELPNVVKAGMNDDKGQAVLRIGPRRGPRAEHNGLSSSHLSHWHIILQLTGGC